MRALLALAVLLAAGPLLAENEKKEEDKDPRWKLLLAVGKALKAGKAAEVAKLFPKKGKVELKLKGIKHGKYREKQARSLLTTYLKRITPEKYELVDRRGSVGKFKMKYKVRADGTLVEGTTHVYLEKEGESWLIKGIVES